MNFAPLICGAIAAISIMVAYGSEDGKAVGFWFLALIALFLAAGTGHA